MLQKRYSNEKTVQILLTLRLFFNMLRRRVMFRLDLAFRDITICKRELVGVCLIVLTAGCATQASGLKAFDVDAKVGARAQARWDALIKGNVGDAYRYLTPSIRATMAQDKYQGMIRLGTWKKAKVSSVSCEVDRCKVDVKIELGNGIQLQEPLHEVWLSVGGEWWFFFK